MGVIIAVAAVVLATRSANSAARSAAAAEWTAHAARDEAEQTKTLVAQLADQARPSAEDESESEAAGAGDNGAAPAGRPELAAAVSLTAELHGPSVIARATVENVGDAQADDVLVSFFVPQGVRFHEFGQDGELAGDRLLGNEAPGVELAAADGSPVQALRHSWTIKTLVPGEPEHWYAQVFTEPNGGFHLELRAGHDAASPVRQRYALQHTPEGGASIDPVSV